MTAQKMNLLGIVIVSSLSILHGCEEKPELKIDRSSHNDRPSIVDSKTPTPAQEVKQKNGVRINMEDGTIKSIESTDGTPVKYMHEDNFIDQKPELNRTDKSSAQGNGLNFSGSSIDGNMVSSSPIASLGDIGKDGVSSSKGTSSSSGGMSFDIKAVGASTTQYVLYIIGVIMLIGAGVLFYFKLIKEAIISSALGLLFISLGVVAEKYPVVFLAAIAMVLALAFAVAIAYVIKTIGNRRKEHTVDYLVNAIDSFKKVNPDAWKDLSDLIKYETDNNDEFVNEILTAKKRQNITKEDPMLAALKKSRNFDDLTKVNTDDGRTAYINKNDIT